MFPPIIPDSTDGATIKEPHLTFLLLFSFSFFFFGGGGLEVCVWGGLFAVRFAA